MNLLKEYGSLILDIKKTLLEVKKICLLVKCRACPYLNSRSRYCNIVVEVVQPKFEDLCPSPNMWQFKELDSSYERPKYIPEINEVRTAIEELTSEELKKYNIIKTDNSSSVEF